MMDAIFETSGSGDFGWASKAFGDAKQKRRYETYAKYAEGDQDLNFATPKYAAAFGRLFEAFSYNRCGGIVDAHADRLQIDGFDSDKGDAVVKAAKEIWERNRMDVRAGEVHKEMFRAGDAYVIVWPESDERDANGEQFPTIWPQRANQMRVRYNDEAPGVIDVAARTWKHSDGRRHLNLYYPDRIEKWITKGRHQSVSANVNAWEEFEPPVPNPWGVVPVFHFANNAGTGDYGQSELRDVLAIQDAVNKVVTDLILAMEMGSFPQKVILGIDADDPGTKDALRRLELGLNKIFGIPADSEGKLPSVAEFSATDLAQMADVVELFDTLVSRVSRVPVHWLQMSGDFPSGRALRTAESPFVSKIEDRQASAGNVWEDAQSLALRQRGVEPGMLRALWRPAAPLSDDDKWELALQKATVGLPLGQILREMGYDEQTIEDIEGQKEQDALAFDARLTGLGRTARQGDQQQRENREAQDGAQRKAAA